MDWRQLFNRRVHGLLGHRDDAAQLGWYAFHRSKHLWTVRKFLCWTLCKMVHTWCLLPTIKDPQLRQHDLSRAMDVWWSQIWGNSQLLWYHSESNVHQVLYGKILLYTVHSSTNEWCSNECHLTDVYSILSRPWLIWCYSGTEHYAWWRTEALNQLKHSRQELDWFLLPSRNLVWCHHWIRSQHLLEVHWHQLHFQNQGLWFIRPS